MNITFRLALTILMLGSSAGTAWSQSTSASSGDQDNVVIVLDASGSMNKPMQRDTRKTRMEAAKEALVAVTKDLPPTTNIGLLVFSSKNLKNDWVYPLKPLDKDALVKAINLPRANGGTPLGAYLKKGADALLKQRRVQHGFGTYRLLMVTDGEANDPDLVQMYLPDVLSRGITVDVIGVDMHSDLALAKQVHSYRRADDPESLVQAVKNVFAEVGGDKSDTAKTAQDFALIAPLPDEVAAAILTSLSKVADHPIGEEPPAEPLPRGPDATAAAPGQYDPSQPGLPPPPAGRVSGVSKFFGVVKSICFYGFIILVILGFALVQMGKSAQRRTRR